MKANIAFEQVCKRIAEKYSDDGWKYAKSRRWMTKKDKRFVHKVFFYTSWNNRSGDHVTFYGEGAIYLVNSQNKIFYLTTHQCGVPKDELYWNVAKEEQWERAVSEFTHWLDHEFLPITERCSNDTERFVKEVVQNGFYPKKGYLVDIQFILTHGSRELAKEAVRRDYDHLDEPVKKEFKANYESMIRGNDAVSIYGANMMRNYSNFRTIIENEIIANLD